MKEELFNELLESVREGGALLRARAGMSEGALALTEACKSAQTYEEMDPQRLFALARGESERDTIHALQSELEFANEEIEKLSDRLDNCDQCAEYEEHIEDLEDRIKSMEDEIFEMEEKRGAA